MHSVWETVDLPHFPRLDGDRYTDVLIVGGGIAGLLLAHRLREAGVDCLVLEAARICGGTTRCTTAKITLQHGLFAADLLRRFGREKAMLYAQANAEALSAYRTLCASIPCEFEEQDSFVYTRNHPQRLVEEARALEEIGLAATLETDLPLPFPVDGAVRIRGQGQFHPLKFAAGLARALPICEQTPVRRLQGRRAYTDYGCVTAQRIVVATHFPAPLRFYGGYFLKLYQHRSYVLGLRGAAPLAGMFVDADAGGLSFRSYGDLLLLGGCGDRTGRSAGGWAALRERASRFYPDAREVCHFATQDCMTLDGVPYIGRYSPFLPDLYVATGFNKWGMTSAMVAAMLLTAQLQGRDSPYTALYSPSRSILRPQLASNVGQSILHLLTPGRRCPHLGCALVWNKAEHSWDCPCHGSRFAQDGEKENGPAQRGL